MTEIPLTRGYVPMIDDEDAELVRAHRWRVLVQPHMNYAVARLPRQDGRKRTLYMHRLVTNAKAGEAVLHADRNGLNNTRGNLSLSGTARESTAACIKEALRE
jgi:hypothetical protein